MGLRLTTTRSVAQISRFEAWSTPEVSGLARAIKEGVSVPETTNPQQTSLSELLKRGVSEWNQWRAVNPILMPDLHGADLAGVKLGGADLRGTKLTGADLTGADLKGAYLTGSDLCRAELRGADLTGANLNETSLLGTNLRCANLMGASLCGAQLGGADLVKADIYGADLSEAHFIGANLSEVDFTGIDLSGTDLRSANLISSNLSGAKLVRANLSGANLTEANLRGADLTWADLTNTNLHTADLGRAKLKNAALGNTVFANTNLTDAVGLDDCRHQASSILDMSSIVQSSQLPLAFLRGCGLPDILIEYLPSLLNQPIQFYSCFISYSTHDQEFADRLYADLQDRGVRCWFAPHHIQSGKKLLEQIDDAIRVYDRLLLILSASSMTSEWVKTEIARARKREMQEKRRILFPVRLVPFETLRDWECFDADIGKDSAREIREYYVPDFSNWKNHDSYRAGFEKLIRDLKAEK